MSQQPVRQAARRSALDAQAVLRKERADRERRLEALAAAVLTALGERDALVRDAERRAGHALREMTDDEGLSLRIPRPVMRIAPKPSRLTVMSPPRRSRRQPRWPHWLRASGDPFI